MQLHDDLNEVLIFACRRPGDSIATEAENVRDALRFVRKLGVRAVLAVGTYEGRHEIAIVSFPGSEAKRERISALAFCRYLQDSVLHLGTLQKNGTREAILERTLLDFPLDGHYERLGYWRAVSEAEAAHAPGCTFVPSQSQHYVAA
jgi:hypothetical protein